MLSTPNNYVILNQARHSADMWILLRRTNDAFALEYRYGRPTRQYASRPVTLEEAIRAIHAFLRPPTDAAERHHALVAWTHVDPEHADAFGVPELRNSYSRPGEPRKGPSHGTQQRSLPARMRFDVQVGAGATATSATYKVRVGTQRNELVIMLDHLVVNKSHHLAIRKGTWNEFPLKVSSDSNTTMTVRASFRPGGWLTAPKLRLGDTIISLGGNSSGVAQALQRWDEV
jgi:hypothetical protein